MKFAVVLLLCAAAVSAEMPTVARFMRPTGVERFSNLLRDVENSRIVGGTEAKPHSRPYQVGLWLTLPDGEYFCGGSLISKNYVMTAAHCIYDGRNYVSLFTVILGAHDIDNSSNVVEIQSKTAMLHPRWNPATLHNDIGLIKLPIDVVLTDNIQLANLPPLSALGNQFVGSAATASGWGKTSDASNGMVDLLHEVTTEVITNMECNARYQGAIQDTHICTSGSNGKNTCNGDSGGPLTVVLNGKTIQVGIASFGVSLGCEKGWPAAFTRVTNFIDWIHSTAGIN